MTSIPTQNFANAYSTKALCQIVGLACIAGFLIDLLVLTFPPAFGSLEWRLGFMQQMSDRSIILLFGLALMIYGILEHRHWRKRLALFCLVLGLLFQLSCILVIRDGITLQQQAMSTINNQAAQIQSKIQDSQSKPDITAKVTPEQLQQASRQVATQAANIKENAKTGIVKTGISSVGNLVVVGLALISLGRYGARPPKI